MRGLPLHHHEDDDDLYKVQRGVVLPGPSLPRRRDRSRRQILLSLLYSVWSVGRPSSRAVARNRADICLLSLSLRLRLRIYNAAKGSFLSSTRPQSFMHGRSLYKILSTLMSSLFE